MPPRKKSKKNTARVNRSTQNTPAVTHTAHVEASSGPSRPLDLKSLIHMPLDILFEIFQHLEPGDLLHLTRTSKDLRKLLTTRRFSSSTWKHAVQNVDDYPTSPLYMSEIAWAHLLFSSHCQGCWQDDVQTRVIWEFGVRYCDKCENKFTAQWTYIWLDLPKPLQVENFKSYLPTYTNAWRAQYIHLPSLKEFIASWKKTAKDDREHFLQERIALARSIEEHVTECAAWMTRERQRHSQKIQEIKVRRTADIHSKLSEVGWGEEVRKLSKQDLDVFEGNDYFRQPQELTDRAWLDMRDSLILILEDYKLKRLRIQSIDRLQALRVSLECFYQAKSSPARQPYHPNLVDIAMLPEVRELVESPVEEDATRLFKPIIRRLPALITRWHTEMKTQLGRQLLAVYNSLLQDEDTVQGLLQTHSANVMDLVDLACSVLVCSHCNEVLVWPSLIAHACPFEDWYGRLPPQDDNAYLGVLYSATESLPWSPAHISCKIDDNTIAKTKKMASICGLDWKTVTWSKAEKRSERFVCACRVCATTTATKEVMKWRHVIGLYHGDASTLQVADSRLASIAKAKEGVFKKAMEQISRRWTCAHCVPLNYREAFELSQDAIKKHLKEVHHVGPHDLRLDDLYLHPDCWNSLAPIRVTAEEQKPAILEERSRVTKSLSEE